MKPKQKGGKMPKHCGYDYERITAARKARGDAIRNQRGNRRHQNKVAATSKPEAAPEAMQAAINGPHWQACLKPAPVISETAKNLAAEIFPAGTDSTNEARRKIWPIIQAVINAATAEAYRQRDVLHGLNLEASRLASEQAARAVRAEAELERERMCHAACGVIALSNTRESLSKNSQMRPEYLSASVQDVIRAVTREIDAREELERLRKRLALEKK